MAAMLRIAIFLVPGLSLAGFACNDVGPNGRTQMTQVWHNPLGATAGSGWTGVPALADGKLFVEDQNNVVALNASSGAVLWSARVRDFPSPAAQQLLTGGGIVFVSEARDVTALDQETGALRWRFTPDSGAAGVFPSVDDRAYYTGQRGIAVVYALQRETGALLWRINPGADWQFPAFVSAVRVSGETVYAVVEKWLAQNGFIRKVVVVALDRTDGRELWRFETASQFSGAWGAQIVGDLIVINDIVGLGVFAVSLSTHTESWRLVTPNSGAGGTALPAAAGDRVYVGTGGGWVYALETTTGRTVWRHQTYNYVSGITVCGGALISNIFSLERYNATTGAVTGHFAGPDERILTSNLVSDGTRVFVTGQDGVRAISCA